MKTTTLADDAEAEWGGYVGVKRTFNLGRTITYYLHRDGEIESRVVRRKGCAYGTRLFNFDSIRKYLARLPEEPTAGFRREMQKRAKASVAARAARNGDAKSK